MSENKSPAYYTASQFGVRSDYVRDKSNEINSKIDSLVQELQSLSEEYCVPVKCDYSQVGNTYIPSAFVDHVKELVKSKVDVKEIDNILLAAGCDERVADYNGELNVWIYRGWTRSFC